MGSIWPSKNVSSREKVKPWFFVTFNITISHIFPENVIDIPQVIQRLEDMKTFSVKPC